MMRNLLRPVIVVASLAIVLGLIGCENGDDAEGTQNANAENSGDMGLGPANDGSGESAEDVGMGGSPGSGGHSVNDPCEGVQGPFCGDSGVAGPVMDAAMEVPFPISPEDSMVPEPWNQLCRVVFTEDVELERGIQVRSGEDYLFSYFSDGFETVKVSLFGITEDGFAAKVSYEAHEDEPRPYVTECDVDEDEPYYGVFRDTTLYQDLELTQEACQLSAGLFGPRDGFSARLASDPFEDLDAESYTYRLTMGGLAEVCNGHQETFMASYKLEFGGVRHNALPIDFMYRPK